MVNNILFLQHLNACYMLRWSVSVINRIFVAVKYEDSKICRPDIV